MVDWFRSLDVLAGLVGALVLTYTIWQIMTSERDTRRQLQDISQDLDAAQKLTGNRERTVDPVPPRLALTEEEAQARRIERLAGSLRESQVLINELEAEMAAKAAALDRLRAEEEQSRQLASLREDEAEAVRSLISATIDSAHLELRQRLEAERDELRTRLAEVQTKLQEMQRSGFRQQALFFALGLFSSIPIGIAINVFW